MNVSVCPHPDQHLPRADCGLDQVAEDRVETVRHPESGFELLGDGSCKWSDNWCSGMLWYSERDIIDAMTVAGVSPKPQSPIREGMAPCGRCQPGRFDVWLRGMSTRDLSHDREARAVYFRSAGKWPARRLRDGSLTNEPMKGEKEPDAQGRPVGSDERYEKEKEWDE